MDIPYYIIYQGSLFHNNIMNVYHDIDKSNEIIRSNNAIYSYVMGSL